MHLTLAGPPLQICSGTLIDFRAFTRATSLLVAQWLSHLCRYYHTFASLSPRHLVAGVSSLGFCHGRPAVFFPVLMTPSHPSLTHIVHALPSSSAEQGKEEFCHSPCQAQNQYVYIYCSHSPVSSFFNQQLSADCLLCFMDATVHPVIGAILIAASCSGGRRYQCYPSQAHTRLTAKQEGEEAEAI